MRGPRITRTRLALALGACTLAGVGVAAAATLPAIASAKLWGGSQTLTKTTCSLGASAEDATWIDQAHPTQTNGGSSTLSVQNNSNKVQIAFIRLSLSSCALPTTGGADAATLTVTVTAATNTKHTISLYPVYSSWSGSSLTWSSAQSLTIGSTATTSFANSTGSHALTVTADVDAAIKAGALWGWELVDTAGGNTSTTAIASASYPASSYRPSLSLSYEK